MLCERPNYNEVRAKSCLDDSISGALQQQGAKLDSYLSQLRAKCNAAAEEKTRKAREKDPNALAASPDAIYLKVAR